MPISTPIYRPTYAHIFDIPQFNGTTANTTGPNRKLLVQDGGHNVSSSLQATNYGAVNI